ncbi:MAG TPA: NUDIX domain-containing protein [Bdellovibrionota bacterium]|nr:NUDIX domain-containing protein [Bdellovibrionota bacterium]
MTRIGRSLGITVTLSLAALGLQIPNAHADHLNRPSPHTAEYCYTILGELQEEFGLPPIPRIEDVDLDRVARPIQGVRDSVVAAIVRDGQVLMNKRGGEIGYGQWAVLGGKTDPGETLMQALLRELGEEIDVHELDLPRLVHVHYHYDGASGQIFRVFVVRATIGYHVKPIIKETKKILDLKWYPLDDLPTPLFSNFDDYFDDLLD